MNIEGAVVISGLGQSQIGRRLGRGGLDLTIEACLEASADAGLQVSDIDGLSTYPGSLDDGSGFSGAGVPEVHTALGLRLNWFNGGQELPGQIGAVITAAAAVAAGLCRHVLVFRTVWEATAQGLAGRGAVRAQNLRVGSWWQWGIPFGGVSAAVWVGALATRYMHDFGMTREQLGWIALNARRNAALNPKAIYRDPMTMDDYLAARMISTPLCLYDCDVPADGSTAVIVSHRDVAPDLPYPAVTIQAVGSAMRGAFSWENYGDLTTMMARDAAAMMWDRTDLKPADVAVAGLYDGFSWLTVAWLEAMRFCGYGEAGAFIEGGERIARDGKLALNTGGGQLSAGRLHGFGHLHEVCLQLRGQAGERQVPGNPEVGVVGNGGGPIAGCALLTRAR